MVGTQILIVSELLIEALDVHSTERVLDVDGPGIPRTPVRGDGLASATRPHAANCVEDGRRLRADAPMGRWVSPARRIASVVRSQEERRVRQ